MSNTITKIPSVNVKTKIQQCNDHSDHMVRISHEWSGHFIVGGGWKLKYRLEPVVITQRLENNAPAMDTHLFIGPEQVDSQATMNNNALVMVK